MISAILITILFMTFSVLLLKDARKWFPLTVAVLYYVLPKEACMIGGAKPNILILIVMLAVLAYKGYLRNLINERFGYVILFYFVTSALISLFSLDEIPFMTQFSFLIKKSLEMFLLGLIAVSFFVHTNDFSMFARTFYSVVLAGSIYGIFSYVVNANPYMTFVSTSFRDGIMNGADFFLSESRGVIHGRISGFSNHPLTWGQLHLLFVIVLPFFKKYLTQCLFVSTFIFSSINIVLTGSRSSLVPLIIFLIGYVLIIKRRKFKQIVAFGLVVFSFVMITVSVVHNEYTDTIRAYLFFWDEGASEQIGVGGSSVSMREDQLENAIYYIGKRNVLVGFGYGFVSNMSEDHFLRETLLGFESVVLKVLMEQGVLGFVCYLVMFVMLCVKLICERTSMTDRLLLVLLFLSYLSSLFFTGERCTFQLFFFFLVLLSREDYILRRDFLLLSYVTQKKNRLISSLS